MTEKMRCSGMNVKEPGNGWKTTAGKCGFSEMKKAREFGRSVLKKGLTAHICYGRIFPHWRTRTSTHTATEYSTRENEFQQKFAKLVLFAGKMPCKRPKRMWFLFELNKN